MYGKRTGGDLPPCAVTAMMGKASGRELPAAATQIRTAGATGQTQLELRIVIKLLMTWDIKPGHESEYVEFVMHEFGPAMVKLGIQPTDAWYTVYGQGPQVLAGGVTETLRGMQEILTGDEWRALEARLSAFVDNYQRRVVEAADGFQL